MAIARTSPIITSISGRVGGLQFVNAKAGTRIRLRPSRRPTSTQPSIAAQSVLSRCKHAWTELSDQDKLDWRKVALALTQTNPLSQRYTPTAYASFLRYMIPRWTARPLWPLNIPQPRITDQPETFTPVLNEGGQYFLYYETFLQDLTSPAMVYISAVFSRTLPSTYPPFRYMGSYVDGAIPHSVYSDWKAVLPELRDEQWAIFRVVPFKEDYMPATPSYYTAQCLAP